MSNPPVPPPPPALLVFDLDGTLLADGGMQVPPATVSVLAHYQQRGGRLAVITGRDDIPPEVQALGLDAYAVHNGAEVVAGGRVVFARYLPRAVLEAARQTCPPDGLILALTGPGIYTDLHGHFPDLAALDAWKERWALTHRPFAPLTQLGQTPLLGLWCFSGAVVAWKRRLLTRFPDLHITGAQAPYLDNMSVSAPGVNKGHALLGICQSLSIAPARTWVFGDSDNDIPMFQQAGHAVQVGSLPILAKLAHASIGSHLELGDWLRASGNLTAGDLTGRDPVSDEP